MKKLLLILSITLTYTYSFSQKNFQPASIVDNNGERHSGEIAYKAWKENPSTITFRKDNSTEPKRYSVKDLKSFSVSGDIYKRGIVELDEREDNISRLGIEDKIILHSDTVFLLTVVSGPKSLYVYTDNVDHFYIATGDKFELLRFKKYRLQTNVATNKDYITQLRSYLQDCGSIKENSKYNLNTIRNLFSAYYKCAGTNPEFALKTENEKMEIGLVAGGSNTTFKINTSTSNRIGRIDFNSSTNVAAGASFDLVFPRQRGRMSFNNELLYTSYKTGGNYQEVNSSISVYDYTYTFKYSYVKLNTMLRYKFFANSFAIFINGGLSNGFVVSEENSLIRVHTFNGNKTAFNEPGFKDVKKHELGFLAGAGVRKNRASLEVRVDKGNGPFRSPAYKANVMRYFVLVGYRIK